MRKQIIAKAAEMKAEILPNIFFDLGFDFWVNESKGEEFVKWLEANGEKQGDKIVIGDVVLRVLYTVPF